MDVLRPLGTTGIRVSPIGLGTVKIGRNTGVKYPRPFELPSDEVVDRLLRTAADRGVCLIDTAPAYGTSEERLGEAFARLGWLGSRERWIVSSKAGEEFGAAGSATGAGAGAGAGAGEGAGAASRFDFSRRAIEASVMRSLARLRIDYLDIVLIHSDGRDEAILKEGEAVEALQRLRARGVVRAIGMSVKSAAGGWAALGLDAAGAASSAGLPARRDDWCDVLMCTLNESYTDEVGVIRAAHRAGVGVLIKKALRSGHAGDGSGLGGSGGREEVGGGDGAGTGRVGGTGGAGRVEGAVGGGGGIGGVGGAIEFVFERGGDAVSSVVVGTINPEHVPYPPVGRASQTSGSSSLPPPA